MKKQIIKFPVNDPSRFVSNKEKSISLSNFYQLIESMDNVNPTYVCTLTCQGECIIELKPIKLK